MFGKKKGVAIESLIGRRSVVRGNVEFEGGLRVDGHVEGNLVAARDKPSMLVISEHGVVEGEIQAAHVIVNGTVHGPVYATELLELQPKAKIVGDVRYLTLEMHQGAVVDGVLAHAGPHSGNNHENPVGLALAASNE